MLIVLAAGCSGIPITSRHGTQYLIIGIGLVHCPTNTSDAVLVTRSQAFGITANNDPAARFW